MFDSHAHLSHHRFGQNYRYLSYSAAGGFSIKHGTQEDILSDMREAGITEHLEPAIGFSSNRTVLDFCAAHPGAYAALGVHPKKVWSESVPGKKKPKRVPLYRVLLLWRLIRENADKIAAVGETGLDLSMEKPHLRRQLFWFRAQLWMAHRVKKPLVLHIRDAHEQALKELEKRKDRLHGGVVHCFTGDADTAMRYAALGFSVGIGGYLLTEKLGDRLSEVVSRLPSDRILAETDSPYVLPDADLGISEKAKQKVRNTPLIIPAVIARIAQIRGIPFGEAAAMTEANTRAAFSLPARTGTI